MSEEQQKHWRQLRHIFKAHPWHGVPLNGGGGGIVNVYIELVPGDTVKYELDKSSGLLKVDRAQRYSNICPMPYGMVPQTYCGDEVASFCKEKTGREVIGDGDPLDICVLSEKIIPRGDLLLRAKPIGGLRMLDSGEADDKIIAVMHNDYIYGKWNDIDDCPAAEIDRLKHYFLTYKKGPDEPANVAEITHVYGRDEALGVISRAHNDYVNKFLKTRDLPEEILKQV